MSDVTVAPEQDAIAESLLGEPQESEATQDTGAEGVAEGFEQPEQLEAEPEQTTEEVADDWLPTEQEKVFPDETLLRYAQRYNRDEQWLSDPLNRQLIVDKINADVFLRTQQEQAQYQELEQEFAPEQVEPTQTAQPQISREQYFQNLDRVIAERTDPQVAKDFYQGFMRVFGVPEEQLSQATSQTHMAFTSHMSKYALNLFQTFFGDMMGAQLQPGLDKAFPGFGEMYERSSYAMAWDRVRNSNPQYAGLPAYGSKEFSKTLHEAEAKFPEMIAALQGQDGKIPVQQAGRAYALLARIASGQVVDPKIIQQATQTGARNARRADVRRAAGNLGSGQSTAATPRQNSQFQSNSDLFDEDTMARYQQEHGRL